VLAGFAPHCSTGVLLGSDDALSLPMIKYADIAWQLQEIPKIAFRCSKRNQGNFMSFVTICVFETVLV
jgi:hypothetical protein